MMHSSCTFRPTKLIASISIVSCGLSVVVQTAGAMKVQANRVAEVALISGKTYGNPFEPKHMIDDTAEIVCIERLGGLLKSYHRLAA